MAARRDPPAPDERFDVAAADLRDVISRLPPRQQRVLLLRYAHDLSIRETARQEGIAAGTVRDALARAHARVRRLLADS